MEDVVPTEVDVSVVVDGAVAAEVDVVDSATLDPVVTVGAVARVVVTTGSGDVGSNEGFKVGGTSDDSVGSNVGASVFAVGAGEGGAGVGGGVTPSKLQLVDINSNVINSSTTLPSQPPAPSPKASKNPVV